MLLIVKHYTLKMLNKVLFALLIIIFIAACSSASPAPGSTRVGKKDQMVQIYIPAGPFKMGSSAETMLAACQQYRDDCLHGFYQAVEPMHTVELAGFWIDQTEVTNAMYALCVKEGACRQPEEFFLLDQPDYYNSPEFANYPVMEVTWEDARTYCAWAGRRLPTEAEWEKAARGTDGRLYPWGNEPVTENRDNFCDINCPRSYQDTRLDDGYAFTAPVGSYRDGVSPYGVLDLAGNLREWTSSLYWPYPYRSDDGREDLTMTGYRVVRGGHWDGTADFGLSAYRFEDHPDYHSSCVGFRCASSP